MATSKDLIQYVPFSSAVDIGFWHKLTKNKLEVYKLDDSSKFIRGIFVNSKYVLRYLSINPLTFKPCQQF